MWREIDNCTGKLAVFMLVFTALETFVIMYFKTQELKLFERQHGIL